MPLPPPDLPPLPPLLPPLLAPLLPSEASAERPDDPAALSLPAPPHPTVPGCVSQNCSIGIFALHAKHLSSAAAQHALCEPEPEPDPEPEWERERERERELEHGDTSLSEPLVPWTWARIWPSSPPSPSRQGSSCC